MFFLIMCHFDKFVAADLKYNNCFGNSRRKMKFVRKRIICKNPFHLSPPLIQIIEKLENMIARFQEIRIFSLEWFNETAPTSAKNYWLLRKKFVSHDFSHLCGFINFFLAQFFSYAIPMSYHFHFKLTMLLLISEIKCTVKPLYREHHGNLEIVSVLESCPLREVTVKNWLIQL